MNIFKSALLALATSVVSNAALAGAGILNTVVTPLGTNVTYAIPGTSTNPALVTYVGYTVSISNAGGNTINNIRFTGTTLVTDTAELAAFDSAEGASCNSTNPPAETGISCTIGQLVAGQSASFVVFFKAPAKVTNGDYDTANSDYVGFSGKTYYAEGTGGANSQPDNSIRNWASAAVLLGTSNPELVISSVPKGGGLLFTGAGGVPKGTDKFSTSVFVPPGQSYTTAVISETVRNVVCGDFYTCGQSQIAIPGTFTPYLTIVLRQDKLNIRPGTKIQSVLIDYVNDQNVTYQNIGDCATGPQPLPNGIPCIAERKYYKNSSVQGWTQDLDGDFEWTIINIENGRYVTGN